MFSALGNGHISHNFIGNTPYGQDCYYKPRGKRVVIAWVHRSATMLQRTNLLPPVKLAQKPVLVYPVPGGHNLRGGWFEHQENVIHYGTLQTITEHSVVLCCKIQPTDEGSCNRLMNCKSYHEVKIIRF
jgi:hypothetical protein